MAIYVAWPVAVVSAVVPRSSGCSAFHVDRDQAQLAGVAPTVLVGQPAVIGPGEHLGEPDRLAGEAGGGPAELAAQDAGEDGAREVDIDGLELFRDPGLAG